LCVLLLLAAALCLIPSPAQRIAAAQSGANATAPAAAPAPRAQAATAPQPGANDAVLWPEPQRAFFMDGPQLLLSEDQRGALARMDTAARQRWVDDFLARAGGSSGAGNSGSLLKEAIARRQRLASHQYVSPADVRAQLLFLNGSPAARTVLDCGTTFKPMEVWTYRNGVEQGSTAGSIVVFRPVEDEPFTAWTPDQGKRVLYTDEMEYWLEQWEELHHIGSERFDLHLCKEARLIDRVTGVEGLGEGRKKTKEAAIANQHAYGRRPGAAEGEGLLDPPGDLARWAQEAAATQLPAAPQPLALQRVELQFPEWTGMRIVTRAVADVVATGRIAEDNQSAQAGGGSGSGGANEPAGGPGPGAAGAGAAAASSKPAASPSAAAGKQLVGLTVEGAVESEGKLFETFRLRFRLPAPAAGQPVTIAIDRGLRPHRAFVMRLKIRDDGSGAEVQLARGFVVPPQPIKPAQPLVANLPTEDQERQRRMAALSRDAVTLVPPDDDVVFGLWRAEALVTGNQITKVVFSVDGKPQYARNAPPYTVELRLKRMPSEQLVRADGYDVHGQLISSDHLILNQPHGGLAVAIQQPARGAKPSGQVQAVADVTVPSERRVEQVEFRINDKLVAKLTQPPWATTITVPAEGDTVYLTVAAQLDDGSRAEDVRFLRSQNYVEEVSVNLVELYTTVVDGSGQLVKGLGADDFQVLEGGQPQTLAKFELVENLPLTLGILIDTSGSMASSLGEAQRAAGGFLQRMVRPGDRCFTLTFADRPVLRMPLTDDPRAAAQSLERLQADGSTSIHDALVHSLYYFRGTHGQRALVLLSDGDDNTSQLTYDEALEYAKHSGVAIYTIGLNISPASMGIRGKLNRMSEATGGRVFYVSKAQELAGVYEEIERELRSRYLLAFQSGVNAGAGGYRQIEVKMRKAGLKARTARGYYP
jgi:VWFA-related protein